ncbi:glycine cleavage system protein GcvH [Hydrogenovibrio marinus]|uniref:Glycine cleavage system protein H n=1 Tax=Hydrogenovibrio marinus TaxID=28885 RepID=A0A066ZPJ0_HYDMR|nr:glycine cleavage system protein GcvH [Hydrogenovibrio marinus]KDN95703.1 glycine cleavage system protein H [Hydrogenovibrio marinus]BBN58816.1 glycine cleavage system H protein [Hydrogenovibrio marinus]
MGILPHHLLYSDAHLWLFVDAEGYVTLGLTDYAQETLGDIVEVFLPQEGEELAEGSELMSLAGERNHFEIFAPISGEVIEVNEELNHNPTLINYEPYDSGWLVKIAPADSEELEVFLTDEEYEQLIGY